MYLESYMSRVLDIPKYRANKDKDKINLVYFIRFIHYKLVSYDKQCLPHSSGEFKSGEFKCLPHSSGEFKSGEFKSGEF